MPLYVVMLAILLLPTSLLAQGSETAIVKQSMQLQQEGPADTKIADYFEKLKSNPNDPMIHVQLGEIYFERSLYELAINSFKHALELQAKLPQAHLGLSKIFRKKKIPLLELSEMQAAVEDAPDDAELRLKLGILYMEPEHFDYNQAKKQYQFLKKTQSPLADQLAAKMGLDHP